MGGLEGRVAAVEARLEKIDERQRASERELARFAGGLKVAAVLSTLATPALVALVNWLMHR